MRGKLIKTTLSTGLIVFTLTAATACSTESGAAAATESSTTTAAVQSTENQAPSGPGGGMDNMQQMETITISGTVISGGLEESSGGGGRMMGNRYTYEIEQADGSTIYVTYSEMPDFEDMEMPEGDMPDGTPPAFDGEMPEDMPEQSGDMPTPSGDMPDMQRPGEGGPGQMNMGQPELSFYADTIQVGDYLEACGYYDESSQTVMVISSDHYIRTYAEQP